MTALTMARAFRGREILADDFERMQTLAVRWSALRGPARIAEYLRLPIEPYEARRKELTDWFCSQELSINRISLRDADKLAVAELPAIEARVAALADEDAGGTGQPWTARSAERPTLDEDTVSAAFDWIDLREARNQDERSSWTAILQESLSLILERLEDKDPDDVRQPRRDAKIPGDFETWVLEHVARALPLVERATSASLWKPILSLGETQHAILETFLMRWFLSGSQTAPTLEAFTAVWQAMLRFALVEARWEPRGWRDYDVARIVNAILGLGSVAPFGGSPPYNTVPVAIMPLFAEAAERWLPMPDVATRWARLASKPEGRVLLLPSLTWLVSAVAAYDDRAWDDDSLPGVFVRYLRAVWEHERGAVRSDAKQRQAFERFLEVLAVHGGHEAQSLRDQVLESLSASLGDPRGGGTG